MCAIILNRDKHHQRSNRKHEFCSFSCKNQRVPQILIVYKHFLPLIESNESNIRDCWLMKMFTVICMSNIFIILWWNTSVYSTTILQVNFISQNKLLKLLSNFDWQTSADGLHQQLSLLKVFDIHNVNVLSFLNECKSGRCPILFSICYHVWEAWYDIRESGLFMWHGTISD